MLLNRLLQVPVFLVALGAPSIAAATCAEAWGNAKTQVREVVAHGLALSDPAAVVFAWRVNGEAFELVAKLHNSEQDLTARRLACINETYAPIYVSVPSYPSTPPPGTTLAQLQVTIANASQQLESLFDDIDDVWLPCTSCMTSTEETILFAPMAGFIDTSAGAANDVFVNQTIDCADWCVGQRNDYDNGVQKGCNPQGEDCAARPGDMGDEEKFECGPARQGTPNPTCRGEITWKCGIFFRCSTTYDEDVSP